MHGRSSPGQGTRTRAKVGGSTHRRLTCPIILIVALAAAACSSDSPTADDEPAAAASPTTEVPATTEAPAPTTTEAPAPAPTEPAPDESEEPPPTTRPPAAEVLPAIHALIKRLDVDSAEDLSEQTVKEMLSAAVVGLASQSYRMEVTTTMDVEDPEGFDEFSQRFGIEATSTGMRDASGNWNFDIAYVNGPVDQRVIHVRDVGSGPETCSEDFDGSCQWEAGEGPLTTACAEMGGDEMVTHTCEFLLELDRAVLPLANALIGLHPDKDTSVVVAGRDPGPGGQTGVHMWITSEVMDDLPGFEIWVDDLPGYEIWVDEEAGRFQAITWDLTDALNAVEAGAVNVLTAKTEIILGDYGHTDTVPR